MTDEASRWRAVDVKAEKLRFVSTLLFLWGAIWMLASPGKVGAGILVAGVVVHVWAIELGHKARRLREGADA